MNCPKCADKNPYYKNPYQLDIYCSNPDCGHQWLANQPMKPFLEQEVYSYLMPPKGIHRVTVWLCPANPHRFSFGRSFGSGTCRFDEFSEDPYLSGSYGTPKEALEAGIESVNGSAKSI